MDLHFSVGVDQYVSPKLVDIIARQLWQAAFGDDPKVDTPVLWTPDGLEAAGIHSKRLVQRPWFVNDQRPGQAGFFDVEFCPNGCFERDQDDMQTEFVELRFSLLQLQHVVTAQQSHQMAMKDQQQPFTSKICQSQALTAGRREGCFAYRIFDERLGHCVISEESIVA
jgi:hypothetical protein